MTNVELINARHVIKNENYNEIFKNYNIDKGMILILEKFIMEKMPCLKLMMLSKALN